MPGYVEQRDEWNFQENEAGLSGTRVFIEKTGGTGDLPAIADPFDADPTHIYCVARNISSTLYGVESGVNKKRLVVSYSSRGPGGEPTFMFDAQQRNFQAGAEAVSIPPFTGSVANWRWTAGVVDIKNIDIFKIVPSGTFSIGIKLTGDAAKNTWFTEKFLPLVGKINSASVQHPTFENFREGSVYFSGCSGGAQYDKYGNREWVLDCQFAWKLIQSPIVTKDDWLYLMRPETQSWDKPVDLAGKNLYEKADFRPAVLLS